MLPEGGKGREAPGNDLVGIALVADVKNDAVHSTVVNPVDGKRELHRAEIGRQMAARPGDGIDLEGAQLIAQRTQLCRIQLFDIGRRLDAF